MALNGPEEQHVRSEAPGALELVRQFVNTTDLEEGWDKLATPESLATWLEEAALDGPPGAAVRQQR